MIYPEDLKKNDVIGVTAPSAGISGKRDNLRADNAKRNLENRGFIIKETDNTRKKEGAKSSSKEKRLEEFMSLWKDESVKAIIMADGGDFACEVLDLLDFEELKKYKPKWISGFSDITNFGYVFTTNLDISTIYAPNYKAFGMKNWHISLENTIKLMEGKELVQNSYDKCEKFEGWIDNSESDPYEEYDLKENVEWKNLKCEKRLEFSGRAIGGCLDSIKDLIGTKYDKVKEYIEKYKDDGIVWFLEIFESNTPTFFRTLWQMKNAGYFKNCNGIIFGRSLMLREDYGIKFEEAVKDAIGDLNIPIVYNADIGHVAPQIPIINGSILEIISENGKGKIKMLHS